MLLTNRLAPRLPTTLIGAEDDSRGRFRVSLSRRSRWALITALISILLHLVALVIILFQPPGKLLDDAQATAPVEWEVETTPNRQSAAPASASDPAPPPAPAPKPETAQRAPTPQAQPQKPVEQQTKTDRPQEAQPEQPVPEKAPLPPLPRPSESAPDGVIYRPDAPPRPATPPTPPPPQPAQPPKPQPQPQAQAKPTPQPPTKPVIPLSPMISDSPFAQRPVPKQPQAARPPSPPSPNRDAMDLSLGPVERFSQDPPRRNESDMTSDIQVTGAQLGSDWLKQLHEWWVEHRRYPEQAVRDRESGTVIIRFDIDRRGYTSNPEILQHSGSRWLDLQTVATFGHTRLPSFPINTPEDTATLTLTVRYEIY